MMRGDVPRKRPSGFPDECLFQVPPADTQMPQLPGPALQEGSSGRRAFILISRTPKAATGADRPPDLPFRAHTAAMPLESRRGGTMCNASNDSSRSQLWGVRVVKMENPM